MLPKPSAELRLPVSCNLREREGGGAKRPNFFFSSINLLIAEVATTRREAKQPNIAYTSTWWQQSCDLRERGGGGAQRPNFAFSSIVVATAALRTMRRLVTLAKAVRPNGRDGGERVGLVPDARIFLVGQRHI
jgi:hypothetical protein